MLTPVRVLTILFALGIFPVLCPLPAAAGDLSDDASLAEKTSREIRQTFENLKSYSVEQKETAVREIGHGLDRLDDQIDDLERRMKDEWQNLGTEAKKNSKAALEALKKERSRMSRWYDDLKTSSSDTWEDVKQGVIDSFDAVSKFFGEVRDDLSSAMKKDGTE